MHFITLKQLNETVNGSIGDGGGAATNCDPRQSSSNISIHAIIKRHSLLLTEWIWWCRVSVIEFFSFLLFYYQISIFGCVQKKKKKTCKMKAITLRPSISRLFSSHILPFRVRPNLFVSIEFSENLKMCQPVARYSWRYNFAHDLMSIDHVCVIQRSFFLLFVFANTNGFSAHTKNVFSSTSAALLCPFLHIWICMPLICSSYHQLTKRNPQTKKYISML